jgi:hypothetical protein
MMAQRHHEGQHTVGPRERIEEAAREGEKVERDGIREMA